MYWFEASSEFVEVRILGQSLTDLIGEKRLTIYSASNL